MLRTLTIILFIAGQTGIWGQFTQIPLSTPEKVTSLAVDGDTVLVLAKRDYFAKMFPQNDMPVTYNTGISSSSVTYSLQVRSGNYYLYSQHSAPYTGYVHESVDRGLSWPVIYSSPGLHLHLTMFDTTMGIFGAANGAAYSFTSDGDNWQNDTLWGGGITSSAFYDDSTGIILTNGGATHRTVDRGNTWLPGYGGSLFFKQTEYISVDTIFSVGTESGSGNPKFYYSYNSGANFQCVSLGLNPNTSQYDYYGSANQFYFDDPQHGYIIGSFRAKYTNVAYACIYETNDYGMNWTPYVLPYHNELTCFTKLNDSTAYLGGQDGLLLKWDLNVPLISYLAVEEPEIKNGLKIFQDTKNQILHIRAKQELEGSELVVYDLSGKEIIKTPFADQLSIANLSAGAYIIGLRGKNGQFSAKFIKN